MTEAPVAVVEPLTSEDRAVLRDRLETHLADLQGQVAGLKTAAVPDDAQEKQVANASRRRAEVEVRQVTAALRRLQGSAYGECALCGGDIGRLRLIAAPAQPYCRHCEEDSLDA